MCFFFCTHKRNANLTIFCDLIGRTLNKTLVAFKWPHVIFFASEHIRYSAKHTRGDKYLSRCYALLAFLSSSDPGLMIRGKLAEKEVGDLEGWERHNRVCPPNETLFNGGGFLLQRTVSSRAGRQRDIGKTGRMGNSRSKRSMAGSPQLPCTFMHAHIRMSACTHSYLFAHTHTRKHSHTRFQFEDFGPICTCMPANQGLSTGRKPGVSQGEIFVMEIWTAGVGKQN